MAAIRDVVDIQAEMHGMQRRLEFGKKLHIMRVGQEWDIKQEHLGSPAGAVFGQCGSYALMYTIAIRDIPHIFW
ncbi:MAG TPA: hypothetical protein HPP95_06350 [Deltaproteobacteria bacterium]|nr:hypothetical protein [Deltaproteobacteria bacterium]